jgi:hypothetical protein
MRRNGFQWPLDPLQVSSWLLFSAFIATTIAVVVPVLPGAGSWAFAAVYGFVALVTLALTARTTASDGADPCVLAACEPVRAGTCSTGGPGGSSSTGAAAGSHGRVARESRPSRRPFMLWMDATVRPWSGPVEPGVSSSSPSPSPAIAAPSALAAPQEEQLSYCYLCRVGVKRRSKHCKVCKKCVEDFDHHCVWLNVRAVRSTRTHRARARQSAHPLQGSRARAHSVGARRAQALAGDRHLGRGQAYAARQGTGLGRARGFGIRQRLFAWAGLGGAGGRRWQGIRLPAVRVLSPGMSRVLGIARTRDPPALPALSLPCA